MMSASGSAPDPIPSGPDRPALLRLGYIKTGSSFLQADVFSKQELGLALALGEKTRVSKRQKAHCAPLVCCRFGPMRH